MSLEQREEALRFIFPVLSFVRVWDKGSTSHIYNEPLSSSVSDIGYCAMRRVKPGQRWPRDIGWWQRWQWWHRTWSGSRYPPDNSQSTPIIYRQCCFTPAQQYCHCVLNNPCTSCFPGNVSPTYFPWFGSLEGRVPGCPAPFVLTTSDVFHFYFWSSGPVLFLDRNLSPDGEIFRTGGPFSLSSLTDKKALIKAIRMNGRPLSTRSDIEEHHLAIRIIDCTGHGWVRVWAIVVSTWWLPISFQRSFEWANNRILMKIAR